MESKKHYPHCKCEAKLNLFGDSRQQMLGKVLKEKSLHGPVQDHCHANLGLGLHIYHLYGP